MPCITCNDENRRNCPECSPTESRFRLSSQQDGGDILCVCGCIGKPKSLMACTECNRSWHSGCVGLDGLSQSLSAKINNWKCPLCFEFSPEVREKLGDIKGNVAQSEKMEIGRVDVAKELYKELLDVKDILINRIVPNTDKIEGMSKTASIAVKETLNENLQRQTKTWADVLSNKQEAVHKSMERSFAVEQKKIVTDAIDNSRLKAERDNVERDKRKRNCVIRDLTESTEMSNEAKRGDDLERVAEILDINPEYVIDVRRAGPPKSNYNRHVIITLSNPDMASEMHNYGRGRRQVNSDNSLVYWINPDLIQTDRQANYNARMEAKNRRQARGGSTNQAGVGSPDQVRAGSPDLAQAVSPNRSPFR